MKINKEILKQIILESLEENPNPLDQRTAKVTTATDTGGVLSQKQYTEMLKQVLLTSNVNTQVRRASLQSIFGEKGTAIAILVEGIIKGEQK